MLYTTIIAQLSLILLCGLPSSVRSEILDVNPLDVIFSLDSPTGQRDDLAAGSLTSSYLYEANYTYAIADNTESVPAVAAESSPYFNVFLGAIPRAAESSATFNTFLGELGNANIDAYQDAFSPSRGNGYGSDAVGGYFMETGLIYAPANYFMQ